MVADPRPDRLDKWVYSAFIVRLQRSSQGSDIAAPVPVTREVAPVDRLHHGLRVDTALSPTLEFLPCQQNQPIPTIRCPIHPRRYKACSSGLTISAAGQAAAPSVSYPI
jgi:hypothetical protein